MYGTSFIQGTVGGKCAKFVLSIVLYSVYPTSVHDNSRPILQTLGYCLKRGS